MESYAVSFVPTINEIRKIKLKYLILIHISGFTIFKPKKALTSTVVYLNQVERCLVISEVLFENNKRPREMWRKSVYISNQPVNGLVFVEKFNTAKHLI